MSVRLLHSAFFLIFND